MGQGVRVKRGGGAKDEGKMVRGDGSGEGEAEEGRGGGDRGFCRRKEGGGKAVGGRGPPSSRRGWVGGGKGAQGRRGGLGLAQAAAQGPSRTHGCGWSTREWLQGMRTCSGLCPCGYRGGAHARNVRSGLCVCRCVGGLRLIGREGGPRRGPPQRRPNEVTRSFSWRAGHIAACNVQGDATTDVLCARHVGRLWLAVLRRVARCS